MILDETDSDDEDEEGHDNADVNNESDEQENLLEEIEEEEEEEEDIEIREMGGNIVDVFRRFLDEGEEDENGIHIFNDDNDDEDDDDDDDDDDENEIKDRTTFDTALPTSHSYLGDDMELLHGRTIHPDGETVFLPLFFLPGVVIVPGQILPLNLFHPRPISMMRKVIAADKTFGLLIASGETNEFASVGVTCEIFSVKEEEEEYGVEQMILKAEGRQRFKIISKETQIDGVILGRIQILPDAYISPQPRGSLICSQQYHPNAIRSQVISNQFHLTKGNSNAEEQRYLTGYNPKKAQMLCTSLTPVQGWVYKLYNPYFLMDCLLSEIRSWNQNLQFDTIPRNPIEFSHWITANLPFTDEMKIVLLQIDSAPLRLRKQIELMNKCASSLACEQCNSVIADKNDLFSLSKRGPMGAYVNPDGHVHETVTFYKAKNLSLQGGSSTRYSWFPGYAWTIACCKTCRRHMGWKFTAAKKGLKPSKFWGLTRASLKPVFKKKMSAVTGDGGGDDNVQVFE